ncbi:glutathione peroxidase 7 [Cricetulus griseus]
MRAMVATVAAAWLLLWATACAKSEQDFYDFKAVNIRGKLVSLDKYRGSVSDGPLRAWLPGAGFDGSARTRDSSGGYSPRVSLVVNVASECGFTDQNYRALQQLQRDLGPYHFNVLAFPCNQFGQQEPDTNREIENFARRTYSVSFPMFSKIAVTGTGAHPAFKYLTQTSGKEPTWNFWKYLVDPDGKVVGAWDPTVPIQEIKPQITELMVALPVKRSSVSSTSEDRTLPVSCAAHNLLEKGPVARARCHLTQARSSNVHLVPAAGGRSRFGQGPGALPCLRARAPGNRVPGRPVLTARLRPFSRGSPAVRLVAQGGAMSGACSSYVSAEQEVVHGFNCPLPGGEAAAVFCCGFRDRKYCCDDPHSFFPYEHSYMWWLSIGALVGLSTAAVVLLAFIVTACVLCYLFISSKPHPKLDPGLSLQTTEPPETQKTSYDAPVIREGHWNPERSSHAESPD